MMSLFSVITRALCHSALLAITLQMQGDKKPLPTYR